jgi:hypothetical protein
MTVLYIDINMFIDFYQSVTDRLKVFGELTQRADKVILPEQTIREFRRNRIYCLARLAKNIETKPVVSLFTSVR